MNYTRHWTSTTTEFALALKLDFFSQLEDRFDALGMTRSEYAESLGVNPTRVSQLLSRPALENPSTEKLVEYARPLGMKVSIIAYDDGDPDNTKGPILSEIFTKCWEQLGRPRDLSIFANANQPLNWLEKDFNALASGKRKPTQAAQDCGREELNMAAAL